MVKKGHKSEQWFADKLRFFNLDVEFKDDYYDFLVEGIKVEVKSCRMAIKQSYKHHGVPKSRYRIGRFDFTDKENRQLLKDEDIWIALIIHHKQQFIFYGFIRGRDLDERRYISIHRVREFNVLTFDEWLRAVI